MLWLGVQAPVSELTPNPVLVPEDEWKEPPGLKKLRVLRAYKEQRLEP